MRMRFAASVLVMAVLGVAILVGVDVYKRQTVSNITYVSATETDLNEAAVAADAFACS